MKYLLSLVLILTGFLSCSITDVFAQYSKTNGLTFGLTLNNMYHRSSVVELPSQQGVGFGAHLGLGFFNHIVLFADADINVFESSSTRDELFQYDLGTKIVFYGKQSTSRPYIGASLTTSARLFGDHDVSFFQVGRGISALLGMSYYLKRRIALDMSYRHSVMQYNELRIDRFRPSIPMYLAQTSRIRFGITFTL